MSSPTGHTIVPGDASAANQATANAALAAIQTAAEILDNVVAGAEAQVDVVTSALPAGASTEAKQSTIATTLSDIKTAVELLDNAISGTEMQVDVVSSATRGIEGGDAIFKLLTRESGPGSGTDMITDYTGSVNSVFTYQVASGKVAYINRLCIILQDANIKPDSFGGISALSKGCLVKLVSSADAEVIDFCDGIAMTTNARFALLAGADVQPVAGTSIDVLPIRWTLGNAFAGRPLKMVSQQKLQWTNQDDLTGLSEFRVMVQGWIEDE